MIISNKRVLRGRKCSFFFQQQESRVEESGNCPYRRPMYAHHPFALCFTELRWGLHHYKESLFVLFCLGSKYPTGLLLRYDCTVRAAQAVCESYRVISSTPSQLCRASCLFKFCVQVCFPPPKNVGRNGGFERKNLTAQRSQSKTDSPGTPLLQRIISKTSMGHSAQ